MFWSGKELVKEMANQQREGERERESNIHPECYLLRKVNAVVIVFNLSDFHL